VSESKTISNPREKQPHRRTAGRHLHSERGAFGLKSRDAAMEFLGERSECALLKWF
jgi:hypothetical protein